MFRLLNPKKDKIQQDAAFHKLKLFKTVKMIAMVSNLIEASRTKEISTK